MAEIHVQAKKKTTPVWVWIVIALVAVAAIAYILWRNKKADQTTNTVNKPATTSIIQTRASNQVFYYV